MKHEPITNKRIAKTMLQFGTLGTMFFVGQQKSPFRKPRVRLFVNRAEAVTYGKELAARLSTPTKIMLEVKRVGQIIRSGSLFIVKTARREYNKMPVRGFTSFAAAFNFFETQRMLVGEELEQALATAETYRFRKTA